MTRKTCMLLCKLMNFLDACMECERLKADNITGLNTCAKWSSVKNLQNKNISTYLMLKRGKINNHCRLVHLFHVICESCKMRFRLLARSLQQLFSPVL